MSLNVCVCVCVCVCACARACACVGVRVCMRAPLFSLYEEIMLFSCIY